MKYSIVIFCLIFLIIACSHNNQDVQIIKNLEYKLDSLSADNAYQDSINVIKIEELEANILFLEDKIELMDQQISFYSDRIDTMLDVISNNSKNINLLQGIKSQTEVIQKKESKTSPQELYNQARKLYETRKLVFARSKFLEFLQTFPNHELEYNAHYWLGEIAYDEENWPQALKQFQLVSRYSANLEKALDSRFKIAIINRRMGHYDIALTQAQELIKTYPDYIRIDKVKSFAKELK